VLEAARWKVRDLDAVTEAIEGLLRFPFRTGALRLRDDVFFQAGREVIIEERTRERKERGQDLDMRLGQIIQKRRLRRGD